MGHSPDTHKPEISMIVYTFYPEPVENTIICQSRVSFEPCVGIAASPNPVHDFCTIAVTLHHLPYGIWIVLKVSVDCHECITGVNRVFHTGHECILMAGVGGKTQPFDSRITGRRTFYEAPGAISTSVVNIEYVTPVGNLTVGFHRA